MNNPKQQPLWYPYAQMKTVKPYHEVVSAQGVYLELKDGRKLIDGVSSWWSTIYGYNHPEITSAAKDQLDKVSHVMLGGLINSPAMQLAEKLVEISPKGLNHVFFSDSGSVAVEVALKMAIQYHVNQGQRDKIKLLSLTRSYHGDTFKTMEAGNDMSYHKAYADLLNQGLYVTVPATGFETTEAELQPYIDELASVLETNAHELAAFIVEPIMQGAGGVFMYPSAYLKAAYELCKQHNVLLICDEVATGLGRTGKMFASEHAEITPDIMVLGKALTAGYVGHAATLATTEVFEQFYGPDFDKALMHGPTFMGNALSCRIALAGLELFERENYLDKIAKIEAQLNAELADLQSDQILDVRVLGAAGCIEVRSAEDVVGFQEFAMERGVWLRPFETYLYTMPAYIIEPEELSKVTGVMREWFSNSEAAKKARSQGQNDFAMGIHEV